MVHQKQGHCASKVILFIEMVVHSTEKIILTAMMMTTKSTTIFAVEMKSEQASSGTNQQMISTFVVTVALLQEIAKATLSFGFFIRILGFRLGLGLGSRCRGHAFFLFLFHFLCQNCVQNCGLMQYQEINNKTVSGEQLSEILSQNFVRIIQT